VTPNQAAGTRPWEHEYRIADTTIVAETVTLRVLLITLDPGDIVPWHYHSTITDRFFALEGVVVVETRAPRAHHALVAGAQIEIGPKTAHQVSNGGDGRARFVLVQGVGSYDFVPVGR